MNLHDENGEATNLIFNQHAPLWLRLSIQLKKKFVFESRWSSSDEEEYEKKVQTSIYVKDDQH